MTYPYSLALITGASSGIGASMARELAGSGIPLVLVARRTDRLEEIAAEFPHLEIEIIGADLATAAGVQAVVDRIRRGERFCDLVVNNAGFGTSGPFIDLDPDRLEREISLNISALTRISHAALATMVPKGRGWLMNVSSVASFQPAPELAVYAATKAYVTSLTESLYGEVSGTGVKVTALCPGLTKTEFQSVSSTEAFQERFPDAVWTDVDEVARAGLRDMARGRAISVPGYLYKGLVAVSGVTPRPVARRLAMIIRRR
jgi:short-subunit dehydrogenase